MRWTKYLVMTSAMAALSACGGTATSDNTEISESADNDSMVVEKVAEDVAPADVPEAKYANNEEVLFKYLQDEEYKSFPISEEGTHKSIGPHDWVRVFYNKTIADSLASKNDAHPAGSMIVKELYKEGSAEKYGWAVSIKTHDDTNGGKGWYWYEVISTTDPTKLYPDNPGNGIPECAGCHTIGKDFVRSTFPG